MGSSSDGQIVGYMYFLGLHAVLAQNKLSVLSIKFAEKKAWVGNKGGGERIRINNMELFGGDEAEGGVSGAIDVLNGDSSQGKNDYLQSKIGGVISAFRGVTSLVFRQFYFGNNPYIKNMAIKASDDEVNADWYPEKSRLNIEAGLVDAQIYIALDNSLSMAGARSANMKSEIKDFLDSLKGKRNSVMLVSYNSGVQESKAIRDCDDDDYNTLKAWVDNMGPEAYGTDYDAGVSLASSFFLDESEDTLEGEPVLRIALASGVVAKDQNPRIILFLSDGEPVPTSSAADAAATVATIYSVDTYCFSLDLADTSYLELLDTTPDDGVPVITTSNSGELANSLMAPFSSWHDLNFAHMLRDAYVLANEGDDSIIGASFAAVADTFADEGMGGSIFWKNTATHEEFLNDVKAHADCVTYADRTTGKIEIKPIRNDFDVAALTTFDKTNVTKWHDDIGKPQQKDLPNQITIVYTKRKDGSKASVTMANIAAMQSMQNSKIIPRKVTYEGITDDTLAGKIAMRDLAALTIPLTSGSIDVTYAPNNLNIGSAFIVNNPEFGINNIVVRLTEKIESGGRSPKTTLTFLEDKFDTPALPLVVPDPVVVDDLYAKDSPVQIIQEVGYYTLVVASTQDIVDDELTDDPGAGAVAMGGTKPDEFHHSLNLATDAGAGWTIVGSGGFIPASTLVAQIAGAETTSFDIINNDTLRQIVAGSLCLVGSEIMRVDDMVESGDNVTITVGRGCLDTVPEWHNHGDDILFYDRFVLSDPVSYTAGETVKGKLLTKTSAGRLSLNDATEGQVTLDSRAIRPYHVGDLKMDSSFVPSGTLDAVVPMTWAHRDRLTQVTSSVEDYEYASIGPEAAVAYTVQVYAELGHEDVFAAADFFAQTDFFVDDSNSVLIREVDVAQAVSYSYDADEAIDFFSWTNLFDSAEVPDFFAVVGGDAMRTRIGVKVTRGGYDNYQTAHVSGKHFMAPINLEGTGY